MHRPRKTSIAAMLCLLFSVLTFSAAPATAHDTATNHYFGDCIAGDANYGWIWKRAPSQLNGVKVNVIAQPLRPCTNPTSGEGSKSMVMATMIGRLGSLTGTTQIAHIGLFKSNNIEDQTYFGWTPTNYQTMERATWVDLDNDGTPDNPEGGTTYSFWVYIVDNNPTGLYNWVLRYRVQNNATGDYDLKDVVPRGGNYTGTSGYLFQPTAWWGCETGDSTASALGVQDNIADATMDAAGYRSFGGQWTYTTDSTLVEGAAADPSWTANPSYYVAPIDQNGYLGGDRVRCQTLIHN